MNSSTCSAVICQHGGHELKDDNKTMVLIFSQFLIIKTMHGLVFQWMYKSIISGRPHIFKKSMDDTHHVRNVTKCLV